MGSAYTVVSNRDRGSSPSVSALCCVRLLDEVVDSDILCVIVEHPQTCESRYVTVEFTLNLKTKYLE